MTFSELPVNTFKQHSSMHVNGQFLQISSASIGLKALISQLKFTCLAVSRYQLNTIKTCSLFSSNNINIFHQFNELETNNASRVFKLIFLLSSVSMVR